MKYASCLNIFSVVHCMLSPIFISQNLSASTKYLSTVDFEYGRVACRSASPGFEPNRE